MIFRILDIKFKLKLLEFQNITFENFNTFTFNWFRCENVFGDSEKQCVSFRIKSAFYKITFWKIKIIVKYLFKKVNKFELRGAHVSSLHTMTNVLRRIYEVLSTVSLLYIDKKIIGRNTCSWTYYWQIFKPMMVNKLKIKTDVNHETSRKPFWCRGRSYRKLKRDFVDHLDSYSQFRLGNSISCFCESY